LIAKVLLLVVFIVTGLVVGTGDWSHFARRDDGLSALGLASCGQAAMITSPDDDHNAVRRQH
jgi:hypothetical protein